MNKDSKVITTKIAKECRNITWSKSVMQWNSCIMQLLHAFKISKMICFKKRAFIYKNSITLKIFAYCGILAR